MTCDMFIWDASKECAPDRADITRLPGTCKNSESSKVDLYFYYVLELQQTKLAPRCRVILRVRVSFISNTFWSNEQCRGLATKATDGHHNQNKIINGGWNHVERYYSNQWQSVWAFQFEKEKTKKEIQKKKEEKKGRKEK